MALTVMTAVTPSARAGEHPFPFKQIVLDNGLKVISLEDFSCPIVAVQVWYHVGSKNEEPGRQGFAHMFEHMMFRGTDRLSSTGHFDNIRKVGGNCNAYTAFDQTVYVNQVPANQLEMVLWLESERMAFLKIDEKGFHIERKVVEEELRMGHNRPYGRVPERLLAEFFDDRPYAWTPGGQISHLRAADLQELADFWNKYYVPNNATLVVVGAVKHDEVQALAKRYFSWIPKCPDPGQPVCKPFDNDKPLPAIELKEEKGPLPILGVVYPTVGDAHPDQLPLEVLMGIIGGGESSRLYIDVVKDQKIAQIALGGAFAFESAGVAGAGGILLPLVGDKSKLMKTIDKHIEQAVKKPITEAELDKMKNQMRRSEVTGMLTVASKAGKLGQYAVLYGDTDRINRRLAEIDAVTIEDVHRVAKKYLTANNRREVRVEPSAGGMLKSIFGGKKKTDDNEDEGPPPPEPKDNRVADRTGPKAKAVRPPKEPETPPVAGPLSTSPDFASIRRKLLSGLEVVVVSNHEVPMVSFTLGIKSGAWTEQKPGVASMTMSMLSKGTKSRDSKQLAETLERNAISLSGSAGMDTAEISGSALVPQLKLAMELLADIVLNPTFPKDEFDILSQQTTVGLLISTKTPEYLADREFRRQLYGDHPYARTVTGEVEDVRAIKIDDMKHWFTTHVRPDNAVLYFAGDITPDAAVKLAEKYLGGWKADGKFTPPSLASTPGQNATHIYLYDRPGSEQSQIRVGHLSIKRDNPDYASGRVLSNILGGGFNSRLNKAIRVDKGLTYGARGGISPRRFAGEFQISTFSKTASTAETLSTILEVVDEIQAGKPSDDELKDTKTYIAGAFAGERETPDQIVNDLWMIETQGLPSDYLKQYLGKINSTTLDQVLKSATDLIQRKKLVIAVVGEAAKVKADLEKIAPVTVVNEDKPTNIEEPADKSEQPQT